MLTRTLKRLGILTLLLIMLPIVTQAGINHAHRLFEKFDFENAAVAYKKYYKKHPGDVEVAERIATCYRLMNDWQGAEPWYAETAKGATVKPVNVYYYAQAARANENYGVSNEMFMKHYEMTGDEHSALMVLSQEELDVLYQPKGYTVTILETNSPASDFGPSLYGEKLYFTSNRTSKKFASQPEDFWNATNFLQMHEVDTAKDLDKGSESAWALKKVNDKYHEGPVAFHPITGDMYLTRTNYKKGKATKSSDKTAKLKIFMLKKNGDSWSTEIKDGVTFNNDEYSVGHVSFTEDGSVMYFSSDMPGGYGGTDIWKASRMGETYSNPTNLGPEINTKGEEMYPFYTQGVLYYASSGHKGLGGLDIYESSLDGSESRNIGAPINSNYDDFAMIYKGMDMQSGYFTSNRPGKGSDDIYKFERTTRPAKVYVYDLLTGKALPGAEIKLSADMNTYIANGDGQAEFILTGSPEANATYPGYVQEKVEYNTSNHYAEIGLMPVGNVLEVWVKDKKTQQAISGALVTLNGKSYMTDANGYMKILTEPNVPYSIRVEKDLLDPNKKYYPEAGNFNTGNLGPGDVFGLTAYLNMFEKNKQIEIKNIYYDLDKYAIRRDAAGELKNLVDIMKAYPNMEISLGSHTDCRMPKDYNQTLSENRAKAAMEYLVSRGISRSRMTHVGYGETQTVNGCDCECDRSRSQIGLRAFRDCEDAQVRTCSDDDHQENRRTVFEITKF